MKQTFEEFYSDVTQTALETGTPIPFSKEKFMEFYKQGCFEQISAYMRLAMEYFHSNHMNMSTEQLYEWSTAIKSFFGIEDAQDSKIESPIILDDVPQESPGDNLEQKPSLIIV
jgi:hypothetical protein